MSPANDFANLAPEKIDFRMGGYITGVIGILIFPWKLSPIRRGYIFTWLIAYSSLLGPIGGIMIADYYFVRRQELVVDELYRRIGRYWYSGGWNWNAVWAMGWHSFRTCRDSSPRSAPSERETFLGWVERSLSLRLVP